MTTSNVKSGDGWWVRRWHRIRKHSRFVACAAIFIALVVVLLLGGMPPDRSVLLAFDAAAVIFLAAIVVMISRSDNRSMRGRARKEDEGYWGFLLGSAAVATVALVALAMELHAGKHADGLQIALAVSSVIVAWLFLNTIFALHYAHEFYGDSGSQHGGLEFPVKTDPDYWDFVYFAFVIGMTFQVSDVQIGARTIRHVALAHSVIAFFFNVIVIAVSVNIVAGSA
ncbi:MAG TPA: DUF1345 domain-containing protein [Rhodanobacteraceae bacterium]|nr:DUF1345 domain-containing protein [Rhodanobacteraceae bacterium]